MNATATTQIDQELDFERVDSEACSTADSQNALQLNAAIHLREDQIEAQPAARSERNATQSEEKARRWMWGFLIALAAMQTYFVQEMLAALFLFTLAFAVFAVIAFAFYLANRASQASLERVERSREWLLVRAGADMDSSSTSVKGRSAVHIQRLPSNRAGLI
jgi:hypothetical protein